MDLMAHPLYVEKRMSKLWDGREEATCVPLGHLVWLNAHGEKLVSKWYCRANNHHLNFETIYGMP